MNKLLYPLILISTLLTVSTNGDEQKPNIVILLADDMGYGEIQALNPQGKIKTPHLDRLANSGMIFTDAHSGSAVCTPTRYGLLTGRYAWRTRLQQGVLTGGKCLISEHRHTLAKMLKDQGYHTAMIGKWHLGMYFDGKSNTGKVPVGTKVTHGPVDRGGFDEFYGFHHARQMNLLVENDKVVEHINPIDMLPKLTARAVQFIQSRKGKKQPFFLYIPWNSPHGPVVPSEQWQGKSGINKHADFCMQTDDSAGQVMDALKANGLLENTIIIASSDNGTSPGTSGLTELTKAGHSPSADLRGYKADVWDGGHRVPFLVSWPGHVQAGSSTDQLITLNDVMATLAEITGVKLSPDAAVDSISFLQPLQGKPGLRNNAIHHSVSGHFAIRAGNWKLIMCPGSGGWAHPKPTLENWEKAKKSNPTMVQLYNMETDKGEQNNLANKKPEVVKELRTLLEKQIKAGRSTAGPEQKNDGPIVIVKEPRAKKKKSQSKNRK